MGCEINTRFKADYSNTLNSDVIEIWHVRFGRHLSECNNTDCQKERDSWNADSKLSKYIN